MPHNKEGNQESETVLPVGNVLQFATGQTVSEIKAVLESSKLNGLSLTPLQLLGVILRVVLKDRITDAEIDRISSVYYDTVTKWYT